VNVFVSNLIISQLGCDYAILLLETRLE